MKSLEEFITEREWIEGQGNHVMTWDRLRSGSNIQPMTWYQLPNGYLFQIGSYQLVKGTDGLPIIEYLMNWRESTVSHKMIKIKGDINEIRGVIKGLMRR